jgi:hypothetical protein
MFAPPARRRRFAATPEKVLFTPDGVAVQQPPAGPLELRRRYGVISRRQLLALLPAGLLAAATPLFAHHAWPVDRTREVTVSGTVTSYNWANPHVMIGLDVQRNGSVEKWSVGGPSVIRMERNGWTKETLKVGDVITGTGYQFQDGQKIVQLDKVVMAGGKEMLLYGRGSR